MERFGSYLSKLVRVGEYIGVGKTDPMTALDVEGKVSASEGFINATFSGALTDGAPTEAELTTAIGATPAELGDGWQGYVADTDGTTLTYQVFSDGTAFHYIALTAAL